MKMQGIIFAIVSAALAPAALAQKIPSAEAGMAPLVLAGFAPGSGPITVKPGDVAWTEQVHPALAVRLLDEAKPRVRPNVEGAAAGTLLFGYQLSTGIAYCPPLDPTKSFKRVQCYRDLDNDGKFDGGYVSGDEDADSRYFSNFLSRLAAVPKYRYEPASGDLLPAAMAKIVYVDMSDGAPRFRTRLDNENMENLHTCKVQTPGVCYVLGVWFRFAPAEQPGALTITFEEAAPERSFDVMNTSDPLKP